MDTNSLEPSKKPEREKLEKVTTGNVTTRKETLGRKIGSSLFSGDSVGSLKDYVLMDLILPAVRDTLVDIIKNTADMAFYGRVKGSRGPRKADSTYISYNSISRDREQRDRYRQPITTSSRVVQDIIFDNHIDAQKVIDVMNEVIEQYGQVSIADYYECAGVSGNGYTDNNYGWTNLRNCYINKVREGYIIEFPRVVALG